MNASGREALPGSWFSDDSHTSKRPSKNTQPSQSEEPRSSPSPSSEKTAHQEKAGNKKHWGPRTCRICLDTVLPTFHTDGVPGIFGQAGRVSYDSDSGHLLRPCKCKGTSKYVHEHCLQAWRHADPSYGRRNFWQCPTCRFKYRLERMNWARWISSTVMQIILTLTIFLGVVFVLGFVADPIINMYLDPVSTIVSLPRSDYEEIHILDNDESGWIEHFAKGMASLGLLGFIKVFISLSPIHWFNWRGGSIFGGNSRRGNTGRDRMVNISWIVILVGIFTFLFAVWKAVRAWSRRTLEMAGEKVMDVQGDDGDDNDSDDGENEESSL